MVYQPFDHCNSSLMMSVLKVGEKDHSLCQNDTVKGVVILNEVKDLLRTNLASSCLGAILMKD
jgi:hypothetical protein